MNTTATWRAESEWCSATISPGRRGWRVELDSAIQGEYTCRVLSLPYAAAGVPGDADLDSPATGPHGCLGDYVLALALRDGRVIRRGIMVE